MSLTFIELTGGGVRVEDDDVIEVGLELGLGLGLRCIRLELPLCDPGVVTGWDGGYWSILRDTANDSSSSYGDGGYWSIIRDTVNDSSSAYATGLCVASTAKGGLSTISGRRAGLAPLLENVGYYWERRVLRWLGSAGNYVPYQLAGHKNGRRPALL